MKTCRFLTLVLLTSSLCLFSVARADRQPGIPFSDIKETCSNQAVAESTNAASSQDTETTIDLVLLIDQSISLGEQKSDFKGTKKLNIELLREALEKVQPLLISEDRLRIGVITFSGTAQVIRNLNEGPIAPGAYNQFVRRVSDPDNLRGYTNYIDAIAASTDQFRNFSEAENCRVLLWFTDGEVDLSGQDPEEDGRSLLESFCGQSSEPNQTEQLAKLNVLTFVVLLNDSTFPTMGVVPENQQRRQDSVIGLRGLTGDWSELGEPDLAPRAPCDDEKPSRLGEVIKVDDVNGLVKQILEFVIRGTTESEYCPEEKLYLTELPSGQLFDFVVINAEGSLGLVEPSNLAGRKFPIVLNRSNPEDAATLDSLERGWSLRPEANSKYLCFGYRVRSGITFQASAASATIRIGDECAVKSDRVDADIVDFGGLAAGQSFNDLVSNDSRIMVANNAELKIGAECKDSGSELVEFPDALRLIDEELGGDGRLILDENPVYVNLRLSQPVKVLGREGIPRFVCDVKSDEGSFVLKISHRNEEVSKDRYRAVGSCRFENTGVEKGSIRFLISPPIAVNETNTEVVILDQNTGEVITEVENSTDLTGRSFSAGTLESLPNKDLDVLTKGVLTVSFNDGGKPFEIGEAEVVVELNLLARSDPFWALVVALVASFAAMLLSYFFLHRILRQTASLGAHGSVSSVTTLADFQISSDGSQSVQWLGSASFTPRVADSEAIALHDAGDTRVGRLRLRVRVGNLNQPVLMLKEPWAEIVSEDSRVVTVLASPAASDSYRYSDTRVSTTKAPLKPSVVLELFAVGEDKDRRQGRLTFVVKNRGNFEEQMTALKREVNALVKTAVNREKKSLSQSQKVKVASETEASPADGSSSQEPKRPPR